MKKMKRLAALGMCAAMGMSMMTACGSDNSSNTSNQPSGDSTGGNATSESVSTDTSSLPLCEEKQELTVWTLYQNNYVEDPDTLSAVQKMEELTNVHINWVPVGIMELQEKFGLLLSSGNFPDIIYGAAIAYPGGMEKGVEDGVFVDLTDLIPQYMPVYNSLINEDSEIKKEVTTDSGKLIGVYGLMSSDDKIEPEGIWRGYGYRKDMLDEWGLSEPHTIDEWHEVLEAAKDHGVEAPLALSSTGTSDFSLAWGASSAWQLEGDKIVYGPMLDGYKEYLDTMKQWYIEGLIDKNFSSNTDLTIDPSRIEDNSVFAFPVISGYVGDLYYVNHMTSNADAYIQPFKSPVLKEGDESLNATPAAVNGNPTYITTSCKNVELALKWLDFQFTQEGMYLNFYGVEGETYTIGDDGTPEFTDLVMNNPDGMSPSDALGMYVRRNGLGRYNWTSGNKLAGTNTAMRDAVELWSDQKEIGVPQTITMTDEEGNEYNTTYAAIETLTQEFNMNYILGTETRSFEDFVEQLQQYGIERCTELQQAAYDRYLAR